MGTVLDQIILIVGWIVGFGINAAIACIATWFLPVRHRGLFYFCMIAAAVVAAFVASPTTMTVGNIAGFLINYIALPCLFWEGPLSRRLVCGFLLIVIEFSTEILISVAFVFAGVELNRDAGGVLTLVMRVVNIVVILVIGRVAANVIGNTIGGDAAKVALGEGPSTTAVWRYAVFLLPQLAFLVIGSMVLMMHRNSEPQVYVLFFVAIAVCLAVDMIALLSFGRSVAAKHDAARAEILERQLALHAESARAASAEAERTARFRHDQRNHLQVVLGLVERGQTGRAADYVRDLRRGIAEEGVE